MKPLPLIADNVKLRCEAILGDGAQTLLPLLGIARADVPLIQNMAEALLESVADASVAAQQVLAMPSIARLLADADAPQQRAFSVLLDLAELDISGQDVLQHDHWTGRIVIPWCRGTLRSGPPLSQQHLGVFEVSARLYFDLLRQPEMFMFAAGSEESLDEGTDEAVGDWKLAALRNMASQRYFLQFARRIRLSLPDTELAKLTNWASGIVGEELRLP